MTLDELFAHRIDRTHAHEVEAQRLVPRFTALRDAIRDSLEDVRVVRHGRTEVRCLVLGNDPETGEVACVETLALES